MKTLTKNKINTFKKMFLQRQNEIIKSHATRGEDTIDIDGGDEIDLVQGAMLKSMADKLSMRDKETMRKISAALQRIEDGTFGACEECGEQISEKRLTAIPDCKTCIECAEQQEKLAKQFRS